MEPHWCNTLALTSLLAFACRLLKVMLGCGPQETTVLISTVGALFRSSAKEYPHGRGYLEDGGACWAAGSLGSSGAFRQQNHIENDLAGRLLCRGGSSSSAGVACMSVKRWLQQGPCPILMCDHVVLLSVLVRP